MVITSRGEFLEKHSRQYMKENIQCFEIICLALVLSEQFLIETDVYSTAKTYLIAHDLAGL